ncbi:hypothetical protein LUZ60_016390 [Juncus effusus]|nr:hypothetical protein LUZ60_016388 [Juncus effusus]KAJ3680112.1 hypothetical protein LUZ60_016390 [Juncus effusus]
MLTENGATFTTRPPYLAALKFFNNSDPNVNGSPYGPLWRLLRQNLTTETLHPSRVKLFALARSWVLSALTNKLLKESKNGELSIQVMESFQFANFCLLSFMCFGERLDEKTVKALAAAQWDLLLHNKEALCPRLCAIYYQNIRKKGETSQKMRLLVLCFEFVAAGTDATSVVLQWIMAELVQNQEVQKKPFDEIKEVKGAEAVLGISQPSQRTGPHSLWGL